MKVAVWVVMIGIGGGAFAASPDAATLGESVVKDLAARRFAEVTRRFDPTMSAVLPSAQLGAAWDGVLAKAGAFRDIKGATVDEKKGYRVVALHCAFARGVWEVKVTFDEKDRVAGLFFSPPHQAWEPPAYGRGPLMEEQVQVAGLPGTLTVPDGPGPFPSLVLVAGSGPNDADETIGGHKVFKDLALGLAARGIATLRYDKRTRVEPAAFPVSRHYTVKEEVLDDAHAAVALLEKTPKIDPRRIYLLGHSLGGMLAPRLAAADPRIKGLVILAGATRPLEDLILEQLKYLGAPAAKIAEAEAFSRRVRDPKLAPGDVLDVLGAKIPGSYFIDLRSYHPARVAKGLKIPMLVLQGGRDYQVTRADYDGWTHALAGHRHAELRLYPMLDHLFSAGTGKSEPADYEKPGHVDARVVQDIADFVRSAR